MAQCNRSMKSHNERALRRWSRDSIDIAPLSDAATRCSVPYDGIAKEKVYTHILVAWGLFTSPRTQHMSMRKTLILRQVKVLDAALQQRGDRGIRDTDHTIFTTNT